MGKKTLKEFVIEYSEVAGWDSDTKEGLYETFEECLVKCIKETDRGEWSWYTNVTYVGKVIIDGEDRFFGYYGMDVKSENSDRDDCGWETPDLDDLPELFPKEVLTTVYVTENNI